MSSSVLHRQQMSALNSCVDEIIRHRRRFTEDEFWNEFRVTTRLRPKSFGYRSVESLLENRGCQREGDVFTYDEITALQMKSLRVAKDLDKFSVGEFTQEFRKRYLAKRILDKRTSGVFNTVPALLASIPGIGRVRDEPSEAEQNYFYQSPSIRPEGSAHADEVEIEIDDDSDEEASGCMDWKEQQRRFHRTVDSLLVRLHRFSKKEFAHDLCVHFVEYYGYESWEKLLEERGCVWDGKEFIYEKPRDGVSATISKLDEGENLDEKSGFNLLVDMALRRLRKFKLKHFAPELSEVLANYYDYRSTKKLLKMRGCERDEEDFIYDAVSVLKWKSATVAQRLGEFTETQFSDEFRSFFNQRAIHWKRNLFLSLGTLLDATPGVERAFIRRPGEDIKYFFKRRDDDDSRTGRERDENEIVEEIPESIEERREKAREVVKSRIASLARRRGTIFKDEVFLLYKEQYDEPLNLKDIGVATVASLLQTIPEIEWICGGRYRIKRQLQDPKASNLLGRGWREEELDETEKEERRRLQRRALRVAKELNEFYEHEFGAAFKRRFEEKMNLKRCGFESLRDLLKSLRELDFRRGERIRYRPECGHASDGSDEWEEVRHEPTKYKMNFAMPPMPSRFPVRSALGAHEGGDQGRSCGPEEELEDGEIRKGDEGGSKNSGLADSGILEKRKVADEGSSDLLDDVEVIETELIVLDGEEPPQRTVNSTADLNGIPDGVTGKKRPRFVVQEEDDVSSLKRTTINDSMELEDGEIEGREEDRITEAGSSGIGKSGIFEIERVATRRSDIYGDIEIIEPEVIDLDEDDQFVTKSTSPGSTGFHGGGTAEKRPLSDVVLLGDDEQPAGKRPKTSGSENSPLKVDDSGRSVNTEATAFH